MGRGGAVQGVLPPLPGQFPGQWNHGGGGGMVARTAPQPLVWRVPLPWSVAQRQLWPSVQPSGGHRPPWPRPGCPVMPPRAQPPMVGRHSAGQMQWRRLGQPMAGQQEATGLGMALLVLETRPHRLRSSWGSRPWDLRRRPPRAGAPLPLDRLAAAPQIELPEAGAHRGACSPDDVETSQTP